MDLQPGLVWHVDADSMPCHSMQDDMVWGGRISYFIDLRLWGIMYKHVGVRYDLFK